jgi:hypothetical protein
LCEVCFEEESNSLNASIVHTKNVLHTSNHVKHVRLKHNIHMNAPGSAEHNEFGTLLPQKRVASDETASTLTIGPAKRQATQAMLINMM